LFLWHSDLLQTYHTARFRKVHRVNQIILLHSYTLGYFPRIRILDVSISFHKIWFVSYESTPIPIHELYKDEVSDSARISCLLKTVYSFSRSIVFRYSTMTFQHSILGSVCPCVHLCHAFQFLIVAVFLFPVCSSSLGTYCFPSFILLIVNSGSTHTALLNVHTLPFALHFVMFISHSLFPMTEGT